MRFLSVQPPMWWVNREANNVHKITQKCEHACAGAMQSERGVCVCVCVCNMVRRNNLFACVMFMCLGVSNVRALVQAEAKRQKQAAAANVEVKSQADTAAAAVARVSYHLAWRLLRFNARGPYCFSHHAHVRTRQHNKHMHTLSERGSMGAGTGCHLLAGAHYPVRKRGPCAFLCELLDLLLA